LRAGVGLWDGSRSLGQCHACGVDVGVENGPVVLASLSQRRASEPPPCSHPRYGPCGTHPFAVDDIEDVVARLRTQGAELGGELAQYGDSYRLERLGDRHVTTKNAPKLPALRNNPTVALTIDTEVHPPKILLIRGLAELDYVDGIPDEHLQATSTYEMTPEQRAVRVRRP
jgi:hypothetical protein